MSGIVRLAVATLFAVVVSVTSSFAQAPGYVRVKLVKAALMVGAGGGNGVLTYRGRDYPFRVSGLSLGVAAGASVNRLEGWASGIKQVSDFAGTYSSVGGGGAFVGGIGGVQLGNEKGFKDCLAGTPGGNGVCRQPQPDRDFPEEVTMQSIRDDALCDRAGNAQASVDLSKAPGVSLHKGVESSANLTGVQFAIR